MTKNLDHEGLSSIANNYELFYIDLWGVIHNGIILYKEAVKVLKELELNGKDYVLLTNAPRPSETVRDFLKIAFNEDIANTTKFLINNREFRCLGCTEKFLWLSFEDFFSSPCAGKDFIKIIEKFDWVFINNFHTCNDDHIDKLRRFIGFIDIAYQEKQKLKLFYNPNLINNLYSGDMLNHLWVRTESRLNQIASTKYLQNLEKN